MNTYYEHNNITHNEFLSLIKTNTSLQKYFKPTFGGIKSKQYCGIINISGEDFYILPKIADTHEQNLNIFTYMLMTAYNIKLESPDISSCENQTHNFLEVLINLFAKNLLKQFTKGLHKTYISHRENLNLLRGKYLIHQNLKRNFTKEKIYCEFDEFSENNALNRFFLYALKTFLPFVKDKKLIKKCLLCLDGVELVNINIGSFKIDFNRQNQRYKTSFEQAMLLLQKFIPLFANGKKSFAFLFDMNDLFEKFVGNLIKEMNLNTKLQKSKNFGDLVLKPDILLSNLIIDTKYKIISSKSDVTQSDKLQAFAYGINFEIKNVMLLYPKCAYDMKDSFALGEKESKIKLDIRTLDLGFEGNFEEYVKIMKERLKEIAK